MVVLLIFGLVFLLLGLLSIFQFWQITSLLQQHQQQTIGEAVPDTKVEIDGYICQTTKLIDSPVTRTGCAYWEVCVYTTKSRPKGGTKRVNLLSLSSNESFFITDGSGKILVRLDKSSPPPAFFGDSSKSIVKINKMAYFTDNQNLFVNFKDDCTVDFLEAHDIGTSPFLGLRRNLNVVEKILVPGDKLFAWGTVTMQGNTKVLYPKLVSDQSRSVQSFFSILYLIIGLFCVFVALVLINMFFTQPS